MLNSRDREWVYGKDSEPCRDTTIERRMHTCPLNDEWVTLPDHCNQRHMTEPHWGRDTHNQTYHENGREYQAYRRHQYMYPCDPVSYTAWLPMDAPPKRLWEQDETFHLDIGHSMFLRARGDKLHSAPISTLDGQTRILDLGTGTGIWVLDMAEYIVTLNSQIPGLLI